MSSDKTYPETVRCLVYSVVCVFFGIKMRKCGTNLAGRFALVVIDFLLNPIHYMDCETESIKHEGRPRITWKWAVDKDLRSLH